MRLPPLFAVAACALALVACSPGEEAAPAESASAVTSTSATLPPPGGGPVTRAMIYAAAAQGPEPFVRAIFAQYVNGGPAELPPPPGQDPLFSRTMNALIGEDARAANGEVGTLEVDPFCQCQDQDGFVLDSMAVAQGDADTATASVVFTNMGNQQTATLDLVREGGNWKVDDVEMGTLSIKDMLMAEAEARS
jgi:hypothetical protein